MFHLPVTLPALRADRTRPPKPIRGDFMVFLTVAGRKKNRSPLQSIIFVIGFSLILQISCNKNDSPLPLPPTYSPVTHPAPPIVRTWKQWALIAFNKSYNLTLRGKQLGNGHFQAPQQSRQWGGEEGMILMIFSGVEAILVVKGEMAWKSPLFQFQKNLARHKANKFLEVWLQCPSGRSLILGMGMPY